MASPTRCTWVWVNSGSWWWTGRPGVLQFMGSQSRTLLRDWTELTKSHLTSSNWDNVWMCVLSHFSHVRLLATPWTIACQAPLCMCFSRHEYWSGLPCVPLGDLPDPGIQPVSPGSLALAGGFFYHWATWEAHNIYCMIPIIKRK